MKRMILFVGVFGDLLGGLWLLQGLGAVGMQPILCFANCAPVQGPSPIWAVVGFLLVVSGVIAIVFAIKGMAARARSTSDRRACCDLGGDGDDDVALLVLQLDVVVGFNDLRERVPSKSTPHC